MLNEIYKALKERLSGIEGVKHLDWFNDQYNGIIHAEPGIFIELFRQYEHRNAKRTDAKDRR